MEDEDEVCVGRSSGRGRGRLGARDDDSSNPSSPAAAASGCDELFLSSHLSTRLLVTWSAAAADAFVGDSSYVLPAGLTKTQALM